MAFKIRTNGSSYEGKMLALDRKSDKTDEALKQL